MTDRDDRGYEAAAAAEGATPEVDEGAPETRRLRRGLGWWLGRIAIVLVSLVVLVVAAGLLLYNFGTMEAPTPAFLAEYARLAEAGQVPPAAPAPGLRIPIPGCRCHAADPDIGAKIPGRQPDPMQLMAHRYLTISQCGGCHGGRAGQ